MLVSSLIGNMYYDNVILVILISLLILIAERIDNVRAESCKTFERESADFSEVVQSVGAIFSTSKYDTSEINYYVMTPSSYPNFVNPNGEDYAWEGSECAGKDILFNCHGWRATGNDTWVYDLLGTFVKEYAGCGVSSDYSGATLNFNYLEVASETNNIATGLSSYIDNNICPNVDCSSQFQLHGHSIGAHTCGVAGYLLKQKNIDVPRMMASDAAGPLYNVLDPKNGTMHLSKDSAETVINIRASSFLGSSLAEWVHQQQHVGPCVLPQNQCGLVNPEGCAHGLSVYMTRSTMESSFPDVKLKQLKSSRPYICALPSYSNPVVEDSLGWKSKGTPGEFKIGKLDVCLDVSQASDSSSKRLVTRKMKTPIKRASNKMAKASKRRLKSSHSKIH